MKKVLLLVAVAATMFISSCSNQPTNKQGLTAQDSTKIANIENAINEAHQLGLPVDSLENVEAAIKEGKDLAATIPGKGAPVSAWATWGWKLLAGLVGALLLGLALYKKYKKK